MATRTVLVDVGGFTGSQMGTAEARSLFLFEVMGTLGYDAATIATPDLQLGRPLIESLARDGAVPLISANLRDADSGDLLLADRLVLEKEGVRIGLTAVMIPEEPERARLAEVGLMASSPEEIRPLLEELRATSDVVVLMVDAPIAWANRLGAKVADLIDVAVVGDGSGGRGTVHPNGDGVLYITQGARGQSVGVVDIGLRDGRVDRIVGREVVLSTEVAPDPAMQEIVGNFETTLNGMMKDLAVAAARERAGADGDAFLGAQNCVGCHPSEYERWLETPHAHAFQTLVDAERESLPECFRCHVTGANDATGYVQGAGGEGALANVQCEECHDKGTRHLRDGSYGRGMKMESCTTCHDEENSPDYDPEIYWLMMAH